MQTKKPNICPNISLLNTAFVCLRLISDCCCWAEILAFATLISNDLRCSDSSSAS